MLQNTKSTYTKKVAGNTVFQVAGKIIVTAISLVVIGYLTRYLGVEGYGVYTTIFAYVSFWAVLADFGFFWILVREISKPGSKPAKIFNNVLTLKFFFGIIVFLVCAAAGFLIPQYSWQIKIGIAIVSASWFWMSLNSTYVGLFQSKLEMYKSVITEIIGRVIILAGVIWLVNAQSSLEVILGIYILGNFVNFLLSFILGSTHIKFKFSFDFSFWKIILAESLPLAMLSIIGVIHFKIDTIILSVMKGSTDVGIYGVPYKILETIILLPGIFMGNVFPILTKYYHSKDTRLEGSIQKSFDFLVILGLPVVISLIILAWPIINLIAGNQYLYASTVTFLGISFSAPRILELLAISIGMSFILTIFSNILTIIGKQRKQVMPMLYVTIINIALNILLIPYISYLGATLVTILTEIIMLFWWKKLATKYLKFKINYRILPKAIFTVVIMGIVLYLLRNQNIFLAIIAGIVVYVWVGYAVKLLDKEMIKRILPSFLIGRKNENHN